jgi:HK97 family phage portal protein
MAKPKIEKRSFDETPNGNPPGVPPASVGVPDYRPGDPHGVEISGDGGPPRGRTMFTASPWSGWPAEWNTPIMGGQYGNLVDTAWACLDKNSSIISTMPPYATRGHAPVEPPAWLSNPDPEHYTSWNEFAKQLWWDFQGCGEAFVVCTARYADGYPARFHVIEPWLVEVEMGGDGRRHYRIGSIDPGDDLLHIRYKSTTSQARGTGPLDAGAARMVSAGLLQRYATRVVESGGVPYYVLKHGEELTAEQIANLQNQWWQSRVNNLGMPAVLSGGIELEALQFNPTDMMLLELSQYTEARIAVLLGVPPFLVGLPSGGDSLTYSTTETLFDYHWRAGLRPMVEPVVAALSNWALPGGRNIELNRDEYVRPGPKERAETYAILVGIGVLDAEDVRQIERFALEGHALTPAGAIT